MRYRQWQLDVTVYAVNAFVFAVADIDYEIPESTASVVNDNPFQVCRNRAVSLQWVWRQESVKLHPIPSETLTGSVTGQLESHEVTR